MKRYLSLIPALVIFISVVLMSFSRVALAFTANDLVDDGVFDNTSTMNAAQIDAWLNNNFGSTSCISTSHLFSAPEPTGYSPSPSPGVFSYSGNVSAGTVIYDAAHIYGVNPQVLLATLQKEQSLVTGAGGCTVLGDTAAMGYGCPDGGTTHNYSSSDLPAPLFYYNNSPVWGVNGTCVNTGAKAGFSQQVIHGAWLLAFGRQRSEGNTGWNVQLTNFPNNGNSWNNSDDPPTVYGGPMTQGTRATYSGGPSTYYDGYTTIDSQSVHMDTGATAALYWYTPHFAGNQNFVNLFTGWFGSPTTPCESMSNLSSTPAGPKIIPYHYGASGTDLTYTQLNSTGSACTEAHVWAPGFTSFVAHIATGMRATDPSSGTLVPSISRVDNQESLNFILYSGAGGNVEVHRMSPSLQKFPGYYDVPTNLSGVGPTTGTFVSGNFFGAGYDQLVYVLYSGSGGNMEIHMFDPTMTRAIGYYDLLSNISGVSSTSGTFVSGDFFGRGYSQLAYVTYGNTEVHVLDIRTGKVVRMYEVPTNLGGTSSTTGTFVAGDFLGRGYSQLVYVIYNNGSRVETHMFNPSLTQATGFQDIITNLAGFTP